MTEFDNTNKGVLFKNDRKVKDSHPDYKGQVNIDGQEFWLSAWIKTGQRGKFMSLSIQPKEQQPAPAPPPRQPQRRPAPARSQGSYPNDDMDDQIPFAPEFR